MRLYFNYAVHDRLASDERVFAIAESAGIEIDAELAAKIGDPFNEVILTCTLNTETGAVTVNGATARGAS
jgi:hypothetical protein